MTLSHVKGLTEAEAAGIEHWEKPPPGSWTEAWGLETGPVSFRDNFDPEYYELEKEAIFRRNWLYIGRVENLPRPGTYFTRELEVLGVSVLVVRDMQDQIRAFHNVCSHRGNKLMWDDYPSKESHGNCRQIACKYHGWRYGLDGQINYVHNAPEFFDLKAEELALPKIQVDTWAGFIFIHLAEKPRETLRDFLTPTVAKLETYPFGRMTHTYVLQADIKANWKLFKDSFQELYHIPYVHGKAAHPALPATGVDKVPFMVPFFGRYGKHRLLSAGGPHGNPLTRTSETMTANALFGSDVFGVYGHEQVPIGEGVNPGGVKSWGLDSWMIYPNMSILIRSRDHYYTYSFWPLSSNSHRFIWTMNFEPPKTPREWMALRHTVQVMREFVAQDANTLEATQCGIESGARELFYLADQEVPVRHFHRVVQDDVDAYKREVEGHPGPR